MGPIGVKDKINIHREREKAAVILAKAYVKDRNYAEAAMYYSRAAFHRDIATELSTVNTRKS